MASRPLRVAVVGVSLSATCGVRDHGTLLAQELTERDVSSSFHWLLRGEGSIAATRAEIGRWRRALLAELARERPDAILVHYSVFSYAYKGLPVFVRPIFATLRQLGVPIIVVLHEFAYPWRYGGWRGRVWAVTQRVALRGVMRAASAAIVTADVRRQWLADRRWLPRRRVLVAPVFSNLPPPALPTPGDAGAVVGLFGYSYQGAAVSVVIGAMTALRKRGVEVRLRLLGAPGPASAAGEAWAAAARAAGVADALEFSGALPAQRLSDALAACAVLLFVDTAGPSSRKGTLAGSLASGSPIVALDGPMAWRALTDADALRVVEPNAAALADAIAGLLADEQLRVALGARGRAFYEREMSLQRTAAATTALLEQLLGAR
jgi:glycosyltransferase involved in cell wall biosynthesis